MNGQRNTSTTNMCQPLGSSLKHAGIYLPITVISWTLPSATKANIQVCTRTKELARAGQDDNLDPLVDIEHGEELFEIVNHLRSKGIVVCGTVESHDYDWRH